MDIPEDAFQPTGAWTMAEYDLSSVKSLHLCPAWPALKMKNCRDACVKAMETTASPLMRSQDVLGEFQGWQKFSRKDILTWVGDRHYGRTIAFATVQGPQAGILQRAFFLQIENAAAISLKPL